MTDYPPPPPGAPPPPPPPPPPGAYPPPPPPPPVEPEWTTKARRREKIAAAVVGPLLILVVVSRAVAAVGSDGEETRTDSPTTTTKREMTTTEVTAENAFLAAIRSGLEFEGSGGPQAALAAGHELCSQLGSDRTDTWTGDSLDGVVATSMATNGFNETESDVARVVIDAATRWLCPEHTKLVETILARPTTTTAVPTTTTTLPGFGDGTLLVGSELAPGRWASGGLCYWERLSGVGGTLDEIIANDNPAGQAIVDIAATDAAFSSSGCGRWSVYAPPAAPAEQFTDGDWVVNEQIVPGTYRADGATSCYWERASGFGHVLDEIIANDNPEGQPIVEIGAGDVRFTSAGCGTWSRAG